MVDYFESTLALSPGGAPVPNAVAIVYAATDTALTTPLVVTDMQDNVMPELVASPNGVYPDFKVVSAEKSVLAVVEGVMVTPLTSVEGRRGLPGEPGPPGAGVRILDVFDDVGDLPADGVPGDAYVVDGDLWVWAGSAYANVGPIGGNGLSAYQVAVVNGYVGDEASWLLSLAGEAGAPGSPGTPGAPGEPGEPGPPGAGATIEPGANVTLDDSDPEAPVLSATGNIIQWVEGVSATPTERPEGAFYMILLASDSTVPAWANDYDTIIRVVADPGSSDVPVSITGVSSFVSSGNVTTTGAMALGALPVGTPVLVLVAAGAASAGLAISNANGDSWTLVAVNTVTASAATVAAYLMVSTDPASDTVAVTRTPSGGLSAAVFVLDGTDGVVASSRNTDKSESNVGSATSGSVTVEEGGLVVFAAATGGDVTGVAGTGPVNTSVQHSATGTGNPRTLAIGIDNVSADGTSVPGLSWAQLRTWCGVTLVFNPS